MIISTVFLLFAFVSTVMASPLVWLEIAVPATPHQFPWMVRLDEQGEFNCGGFLLRSPTNEDQSDLVMTAAHCIAKGRTRHYVNQSSLTLILGAHARTDEIEKSQGYNKSERRQVKHMLYHSKWSQPPEGELEHDIALIQLDKPVEFSEKIKPIDLPKKGELLQAGDKCKIAGWGALQTIYWVEHKFPDVLMHGNVVITTESDCRLAWRNNSDDYKMFYCAGPENKKAFSGVCNGDSGGPLFRKNNQGKWIVHGVVSHGMFGLCEEGKTGPQKAPDKYVKIEANLDWISETIKKWSSQES